MKIPRKIEQMQQSEFFNDSYSAHLQQCASTEHRLDHNQKLSFHSFDPSTHYSPLATPESASTNRSSDSHCSTLSQTISNDDQSYFCASISPNHCQSDAEMEEALSTGDETEDELNAPSYETILFYEILQEFPDLAAFISHDDFPAFSQTWLELQRQKDLARYPANRPAVQTWLKSTALQIHFNLVTLATNNPGNTDQDSKPRRMFSAWRRLKDRVEVTHQVFNIIEDRRVLFRQTPTEATVDLKQAAAQLKEDLEYLEHNSAVVPIVNTNTEEVQLKAIDKVEMTELIQSAVNTYNLMSYNSNATSAAAHYEDNKNLITEDRQDLQTSTLLLTAPYSPPTGFTLEAETINSTEIESCKQVVECRSQNKLLSTAARIDARIHPQPTFASDYSSSPSINTNIQALQALGFIRENIGWSVPTTPQNEMTQQHFFMSLPSSPIPTTSQRNGCMFAPCNTATGSSMSPATTSVVNSPINTLSEDSLDYRFSDSDFVTPLLESKQAVCENTSIEEIQTRLERFSMVEIDSVFSGERKKVRRSSSGYESQEIDEEADDEDGGAEDVEAATQQSRRMTRAQPKRKKRKLNLTDLRNMVPVTRSHTRRTATSYDAETTYYLKSIFYNVFSRTNKLTKDERRQIQEKTGLKSRNITYWFSNHKRRFHASLELFRKVVEQSQGKVKTYDDFLKWRRSQGLPEEILDNEMINEEF